jgi:hypothetical protein
MAQGTVSTFECWGSYYFKKGDTLTASNLPSGANILRLALGVRITDEMGQNTPLRGARVTISISGITPPITPLPIVPSIWLEGITTYFNANHVFEFHENCVVNFGKEVII